MGHEPLGDVGHREVALGPQPVHELLALRRRELRGLGHDLGGVGGEQRVGAVDQRIQRRQVDVDHRPDVPPQPGVEPDLAVRVHAVEEPPDDALSRVRRGVIAARGRDRGHVVAALGHVEDRAERDLRGRHRLDRPDVPDRVAVDPRVLARRQQHVLRVLERRGGRDPDQHDREAGVGDVAAVATAVAADQLDERDRHQVVGHRAARGHTARELLRDRGQHEAGEREHDQRERPRARAAGPEQQHEERDQARQRPAARTRGAGSRPSPAATR